MWVSMLLVAWIAAIASCARLCRAAVAMAAPPPVPGATDGGGPARGLGLYEAAFLAGGPQRVTDLTLFAMALERRMHLAHTGWATVVDPVARDEVERSLIDSIGPEGQLPVPPIRTAHAATEAVRSLGRSLVEGGLAVPEATRAGLTVGIRQVRAACALVVGLMLVTVGLGAPGTADGTMALWFTLPLMLTVGCLLIARVEVSSPSGWASPAGQEWLRAIRASRRLRRSPFEPMCLGADEERAGSDVDGRGLLTEIALRGPTALPDPALKAALGETRPHGWHPNG